MEREGIFELINQERLRQITLWGTEKELIDSIRGNYGEEAWDFYLHQKAVVMTEEVGEVARAILEADSEHLKTELVQVAAVCVAMIEGLRWQTSKP